MVARLTAVEVRGLSKRFGATQALRDVDLDVVSGRVLALLGQNGAGKSTVIKILAGVHAADSGEVRVGGHLLGSAGARGRVAFVHQDLGLVNELSVAENIALGTGFPRRRGLVSWREVQRRAERALTLVGCDIDPRTAMSELPRTERSLVAIGRALVVDAEVLVLDEPTASLPVDETERLFQVLRELRSSGLGLVYVSHRLDEVFQIADDMVVLRDGVVVGSGAVADATPAEVVRLIVGQEPERLRASRRPAEGGTPALELRDVAGERVGPVSLDVAKGEVVGLVGLAGAGMVQLGRGVAGVLPVHTGQILVDGVDHRAGTVRAAVGAGISFVTSNRLDEGLAASLSVLENLLPNPSLRGHGMWRPLVPGQQRAVAQQLVQTFGIQPSDPALPATALSGGNQQKLVIGRWLSTDARVLVLEEPTAGVDVGAKADLYALLDDALDRGVGVLLISTDVEEIVNVCHRALVMKDGLVVAELPRAALSVERLVAASSGIQAAA